MDVATFVQKNGLIPFPNEASVLQHYVGLIEPLQHPSQQLTTMSENAMDYLEDEVSETVVDGIPPPISSYRSLPQMDDFSGEFDVESLLAAWDSNQNTNTNFSGMLLESPDVVVSDNEVKKKLFFFFTITKWFLNYERMAAAAAATDCSDRNDNQKRRRIS